MGPEQTLMITPVEEVCSETLMDACQDIVWKGKVENWKWANLMRVLKRGVTRLSAHLNFEFIVGCRDQHKLSICVISSSWIWKSN